MSYVTAITDRVLSDITTPTSKGYFNVVDWNRVYGNAQVTSSLVEILLSIPIVFNTVAEPTITTIPTANGVNALTGNIERLRLEVITDLPALTTEIKDDWGGTLSPKYTDVNLWESTIDAIWDYYNGASYTVCPTLSADLTITTGNQGIYIDCIDAVDYNIDLQGTANLYII